jgi:hypothetical protein
MKLIVRALSSILFAGFVLPLWYAHTTAISAIYQIADKEEIVNSMPYPSFSRELAAIGYIWLGLSMLWLFWYVTRKPNNPETTKPVETQ